MRPGRNGKGIFKSRDSHENLGCFKSPLCTHQKIAYLIRFRCFSYVKYFVFTVYILVLCK